MSSPPLPPCGRATRSVSSLNGVRKGNRRGGPGCLPRGCIGPGKRAAFQDASTAPPGPPSPASRDARMRVVAHARSAPLGRSGGGIHAARADAGGYGLSPRPRARRGPEARPNLRRAPRGSERLRAPMPEARTTDSARRAKALPVAPAPTSTCVGVAAAFGRGRRRPAPSRLRARIGNAPAPAMPGSPWQRAARRCASRLRLSGLVRRAPAPRTAYPRAGANARCHRRRSARGPGGLC